jgi:hypothetical protein
MNAFSRPPLYPSEYIGTHARAAKVRDALCTHIQSA